MTDLEFTLSESVRLGRAELSYCDYLRYLRGLLLLAGDIEEAAALRQIVLSLDASDRQLELIASGQLKLHLDPPAKSAASPPPSRDGVDGAGLPPHGPHGEIDPS